LRLCSRVSHGAAFGPNEMGHVCKVMTWRGTPKSPPLRLLPLRGPLPIRRQSFLSLLELGKPFRQTGSTEIALNRASAHT